MSVSKPLPVNRTSYDFLTGGGEMGARMRAHNWETTPLGSPSTWPQSLRSALSICLGSSFQIAIYWGPELALLYNDAWSQIPGQKHPWALGRPGREVWPEIWDTIGPLFARALNEGEATLSRDQLLPMHRRGFTDECYFDYTFSPIRDEAGCVAGIFNIAVETTLRFIGERRTRLLKDLGELTNGARTAEEVCTLAGTALGSDFADMPFCLIYLKDAQHPGRACLTSATGLAVGGPASSFAIDLSDSRSAWPIAEALGTGASVLVEDCSSRFGMRLPGGLWPEPCEQALVLPLPQVGTGERSGALVIGISPRLQLDAEYHAFLDRLATLTATAIANARAYDEERQRAEALAELDRAKTAFFSNISHEFRTPLTLMLGPIEDILAKPDGQVYPENRELLEVVHRSGLRLQRLVNTLLDFSRIEAGRAQASFGLIDLAAFTAELASSFRSAMERAGLAFTVKCPPLSQPVYVDRQMWEKIVLNLLSNAFKYTLEGSVSVRLTEDDGRAVFSVEDTGPGIAEAEVPRLFERFHRVEGTQGRTHEGTGIGLALVQELVKLHSGTVSVASVVGRGSTFTVSLPFGFAHLPQDRIGAGSTLSSTALHADAYVEEALRWLPEGENGAAQRGAAAPQAVSAGVRSRVLLADDNADMRDYVQRLLSSHYEVTTVVNGEEALQSALAQPPDLVLTDAMMPGLDGFELLAALRIDERTKTLPVLMLSARAGEQSRLEGLGAGADDYLVKPFSARELLARVEAHLSLARMRKEADQARRLSEVRLGLALEQSGTVAWQWDPIKDEITSLGDLARIFGTTLKSSVEGLRLVHPDDVPAHAAKLERVSREGGSFHSEFRIRRADTGAMAWLEERGTGIRGEDARVLFLVGVVADITERKRIEQRNTLLLKLEDALRPLADAHEITQTAAGLVGEHLNVNRCAYADVEDDEDTFNLTGDYNREVPSIVGRYTFTQFGSECLRLMREGSAYVVEDAETDLRTEDVRESYRTTRIRSVICVPVRKQARFAAVMAVHEVTPRRWRADEVELVQVVANRCWESIERTRVEHELRQSEERLRLATEHAEIGFWDVDEVHDALIWPPRVKAMFGISADVPVSMRDFYNGLYPEDRAATAKAYAAAADPVRRALYDVEYRTIGKEDGRIRWVAAKGRGIFDECGRCLRVIGTAIDITERRRMEQEVVASRERLNQVFQQAPVAIIMLRGPEYRVELANPSYLALLPERRVVGRPFAEVIPEVGDDVWDAFRQVMETGEPFVRSDFHVPYDQDSDGVLEDHWFNLVYHPFRESDGSVSGLVAVCSEVTAQVVARRELERVNRELEEFAYVASHDLQEPLRMVNIYSQLLVKKFGNGSEVAEEYASFVRQGVTRMETLIRDLLTYSRTIQREELPVGRADLSSALTEATAVLQSRIEENGAVITTEPLPAFRGDTRQLAHVFQNLLSNALKYRKTEFPPEIHISAQKRGEEWVVSVRDNGIGFEQKHAERIFGLFKRLHKDEYPGTGLGLAICQRIVERYGGRMWAEGRPGEGATFSFALPAAEVE